MMIDTHCHAQFNAYNDDREVVLARCRAKNMILNVVGTQRDMSEGAIKLAEENDFIYATIGLHPIQEYPVKVEEESTKFQTKGEEFDFNYYNILAKNPKVIGIGETGFDRYHLPKDKSVDEIMEKQKQVFLAHVQIALENDLPLVIHVRDAHHDLQNVLAELKKENKNIRGVVHCFGGTAEDAKKYLDYGLYLGFTGNITFPANKESTIALHETIKMMPMEKILIETDAPFLAPQAYRGQRCEPWMVEEVAKKIAELKNLDFDEVLSKTSQNALVLFSKIKE